MDVYQFNHGINQCTNVSKLSAGWLIRNILMENKEKFFFFWIFISSHFVEFIGLKI